MCVVATLAGVLIVRRCYSMRHQHALTLLLGNLAELTWAFAFILRDFRDSLRA